ncbi:TonB-dependent siderophore receptor [Asticcacaulis solisilvae]|uniref:TonB-dependent siderophore receptor n=1 Tax=Asticcacaulis solisilvae TaxID=1217274 RepID=UPI003FD7780D
MRPSRVSRTALLLSSAFALVLMPALSHAADAASDKGAEVVVIGKRVIKGSAGATGLDLSLRETPQSVTVVSSAQIRDFGLSDANQLLVTIPGINVEADETDRTYYNSRGFDIINFQVDGVGQPLDWGLQVGALDTAIYDRVEAIRGATGMLTGTGNPSATINYIRKRPTKTFQADVTAGYGSWNDLRLTADVSGPLNKDGTLAGRFVYAHTSSDSYLDYYSVDRSVYYGVLSYDITPRLKLTGGYSQQDNLADGVTWGALPLNYTDGTPIPYKVSASSAAPWTYWNTHDHQSFAELSYAFDNGWTVKGIYTRKSYNEDAKLLYPGGNPDKTTGLDPTSDNGAGDLGITAYSGIYPSIIKQDMFDVIATGDVSLFGREHQVVFGINSAHAASYKWERFAAFFNYGAILNGVVPAPPEPTYPDAYLAEQIKTDTTRAYGAIHLNLTDRLKGIVGFNAVNLKSIGASYGVGEDRSEDKVSPYVGAVYDVSKNVSLYASYSDIFNPQSQSDINFHRFDAATGKSYEAGLKSDWFDGRLYATAAAFKSEQYGLAEFAGYLQSTNPAGAGYNADPALAGKAYYVGIDTLVKGYELEVAGKLTADWTLNGGWTDLTIKDPQGNTVRNYLPRKTLKLATTYAVPHLRDLKLGADLRWQSDVSTTSAGYPFVQKAYAVADLMGSIRVTDRIRATLNVKNAFDKTYFGGLQWDQAFYAAPRSVMLTLDYKY